jgi:hypothetical protein
VPVHPSALSVEQDGSGWAVGDRPVDGAADGGRERDQVCLVALAVNSEYAVAASFAE